MHAHQANLARLHALRATSAALTARLRAHLAALAATRAELLRATPLSLAPAPAAAAHAGPAAERTTNIADLLSYAQRIARRPPPPGPADRHAADAAVDPAVGATAPAAHARTPPPQTPPPPPPAPPLYPDEATIRRGALAQIQGLRDRGGDPAIADLAADPAGGEHTDADADVVTIDAAATTTRGPRPRDEQQREVARLRAQAQASVFDGFELYNPDDE